MAERFASGQQKAVLSKTQRLIMNGIRPQLHFFLEASLLTAIRPSGMRSL
jgi:hypothetical protein